MWSVWLARLLVLRIFHIHWRHILSVSVNQCDLILARVRETNDSQTQALFEMMQSLCWQNWEDDSIDLLWWSQIVTSIKVLHLRLEAWWLKTGSCWLLVQRQCHSMQKLTRKAESCLVSPRLEIFKIEECCKSESLGLVSQFHEFAKVNLNQQLQSRTVSFADLVCCYPFGIGSDTAKFD